MGPSNDYGTNSHHAPPDGDVHGTDEESPMLAHHTRLIVKETRNMRTRVYTHMTVDINKKWGDVVLLACYIITGLLDSSSISIWSSFVSMQTGNTVYLGLGIVDPTASTRWIKAGTSISFFCLGSLYFSTFHRFFSPRRRWVLVGSYLTQMLLVLGAALIVMIGPKAEDGLEWSVLVPLAMLAFQSSGQAVTSRVLQYNGLPSVVLTSTYCDLFSDPKLFTTGITENVERNRRIAAPILLLFGAITGGLFTHSESGIAGALWTAVVLKFFVVITWMCWPAEMSGGDN